MAEKVQQQEKALIVERAGLNWELEDERTHSEKAREDFLATREIMKDYPTHRELMAKQGKSQTE